MLFVFSKVRNKEYICKSRKVFWTQGCEEAIYFGSATSDRRLRIYNKAMERKVGYHWIRVEFQLRKVFKTKTLARAHVERCIYDSLPKEKVKGCF